MQISVTEWLDRTAGEFPEQLALADGRQRVSYGEYRAKALAIARQILALGGGVQQPVVVFMEKGVETLVSFLGVAYSRDFYSPIDVDMPASRVDKILGILQPKLVITTAALKSSFERFDYSGAYLIYEDVVPRDDDWQAVRPVTSSILDTDLLYVLFTSGSTGVPKGVGIRHRSVIDYIDWVTEEFHIGSGDAFGSQAPFYFDNSILDIYSTLKTGAALYIIPKELFSRPSELMEYIRDNRITTLFWVPTELIMVARMRAFKKVDVSGVLKRVLFCGEVMPNRELNQWRKALPDVTYANLYGPTEITDACTFYRVDREFANEDPLPIGRAIRNTEVLLLDEDDRPVSPGEVGRLGELCVKGTCLAVGYYNDPQKTQAAFVQNPLNRAYEEKLYRTGDLASYNEYGELMYHGRKDFQIKHLGHRIELGEIETAVSSFADVGRSCCLYDEKHARIVLFLTSDVPGEQLTRETVRERLTALVPGYMIPEKVVRLEELPLNANGKIDRNRLRELL